MSILMLLASVFLLCMAAWFVDRSNWPDPAKWFAWAIVFVLAILLFVRVSGVSLGSI